jgi:hypothetical protein
MRKIFLVTLCIVITINLKSQTIWIPGTTIGNNTTNSNIGIGTGSIPTNKFHLTGITAHPVNLSEVSQYSIARFQQRPDYNHSLYILGDAGTYVGLQGASSTTSATNIAINPFGGNVAIGLSNPQSKLDIYQQSADNSNKVLVNITRGETPTGGSSILRLWYNAYSDLEQNGMYSGAGLRYGTYGDFNIVNNGYGTYGGLNFVTQANVRMSILPNGNIGIGTSTPSSKLSISGNLGVNGNISEDIVSYIVNSSSSGYGLAINAGGGTRYVLSLRDYTANEKHFFRANGDAGHTGNLSVTGSIHANTINVIKNAHSAGANDYNMELYSSDLGDPTKYLSIRFHQANQYWGQIRFNSAGFRLTGGADDNLHNLTLGNLYSMGKIGIGTTNPGDYKLNVAGKIRADEIVVNTTGADFVFAPGYKLPTLSELESYIKENNHLPDLASANEMKENGMSVSEMQTKLLQKIEELTLYSIEQEKKNLALENEVKELKNLIMKTLNSLNK